MAEIRVLLLDGGLTLAVETQPNNPGVSLQILAPVGAVSDPDGLSGSAGLIETWLWKGAGSLSARAFAERLDALGVRRGSGAGLEYTTFAASMLADQLGAVVQLYATLIFSPDLPDEAFDSVRALALHELAALEDQPARKMFQALRERVFESPHGRNVSGDEQSLRNVEATSLRAEYTRRYRSEGMIVAAAGGVTMEALRPLVERWLLRADHPKKALPPIRLSKPGHRFVRQQTEQVQIGLIYPDLAPQDPDFYTARMGAQILSGGTSSRLFTEVREKRGLVYDVSASPVSLSGFGYLAVYAGTTQERAAQTLETLQGELGALADGVREEELRRAVIGVKSALVMQQASSRARAAALARDLFSLGRVRGLEEIISEIDRVSLERLNRFLLEHPYKQPWSCVLGPQPVEVRA